MARPAEFVKVKRELLAACLTCPLCNKLLREAATISECLHTFCRNCILEKLNDEEVDCCPICNIDLGCIPVEKLRPDHNLQDVRTKIFPLKRRKVNAPEIVPSITLPVRRKERSLSSLVVNTPRVATQTGLTGRRTKTTARRASTMRGLSPVVDETVKTEGNNVEDHAENLSSLETLTKMTPTKKQNSSNAEPANKDLENDSEPFADKPELWKPLNCLLEAANRTGTDSVSQGPVIKAEDTNDPDSEVHMHKAKGREHPNKSKIQEDKNGGIPESPPMLRPRRRRKGRDHGTSTQALVDAAAATWGKRATPVWLSLAPSPDQKGDLALPQRPPCYLRIKDPSLPVSYLQKYVAKKHNIPSEAEVELTCQGQSLSPTLPLHGLADIWLQNRSPPIVQAAVGSSAKEVVMVVNYSRKDPAA